MVRNYPGPETAPTPQNAELAEVALLRNEITEALNAIEPPRTIERPDFVGHARRIVTLLGVEAVALTSRALATERDRKQLAPLFIYHSTIASIGFTLLAGYASLETFKFYRAKRHNERVIATRDSLLQSNELIEKNALPVLEKYYDTQVSFSPTSIDYNKLHNLQSALSEMVRNGDDSTWHATLSELRDMVYLDALNKNSDIETTLQTFDAYWQGKLIELSINDFSKPTLAADDTPADTNADDLLLAFTS